jgi:AbiV family abortive infection protein
MGNNINHIYQKTFSDLTSKESKEMNDIIFKNARQLKKDALLIAATNKSYSRATSLLILSSEEIIKAILVLLHSEGYKVYQISDAKKFFFDHKIRHQLAQLIEITIGAIESIDKWDRRKPSKFIQTKSEEWNRILNGILDLTKVIEPILKSTKRIKDLENFNDSKNNGLYVGYKGQLIVPQELITATDYRITEEIVERLFRVYKMLKILYHPCVIYRKNKNEIEEAKMTVKAFVDQAIEGFSFKEMLGK